MIKTIDDMKMCYVPRHDKEVFELFMDKCEEFGLSWSAYGGGEPRDIKSGEVVVFNGSTNKLLTHASEAYVVVKEYKRLTLSDLKPRTRTEYEKVTESIFDLRDEFERGELYQKCSTFKVIGGIQELATCINVGNIYRKVEKEIDWREEVMKYLFENDYHNSRIETNDWIAIKQSFKNDEFLEMCRVALRANGELHS